MDVSGSDAIIVTDSNNKCIKSLFTRNMQQDYSRLTMNSAPTMIAKLQEEKIAVIDEKSKQITLVSVTPDLFLDSTITTQKEYIGLTALTTTTLAAGSGSPPCVDIIDESGNVMRSISPIHNGEKIIQKPFFMCTTRQGNILISDFGTKSVVCVTPQGEFVFNYSPTGDRALRYPAGITSTSTGHILVADKDGDKVIQLNESGEFVRDLLTSQEGICYPVGVDWAEKGRIYVIHLSESEDLNVQVYRLT